MKKNFRVIQINGFRGLLLLLFSIACLIAGFVAFPALVAMHTWNYLSINTSSFPTINIGQAILLWAIIVFSNFIFNKKKFIVSFNGQQELSDEEVKEVISKIKAQKNTLEILQTKDINIQKNLPAEESGEKEEHKEISVLQSKTKEN